MSLLDTLRQQESLFLPTIPQKPQGRYVHFVLLRETESFPLFQTDGSLNVIRVRAGNKPEHKEVISRLVLFKRKQTSPERLTGRELLRFYDLITDTEKQENSCIYNSKDFCKQCPDCILYGYAIGSEGAEKSKVYVDSAFSITRYERSHKAFSFNALYEHGTMTEKGKHVRALASRIISFRKSFSPALSPCAILRIMASCIFWAICCAQIITERRKHAQGRYTTT